MVKEINDKNIKMKISRKILEDLPEWFGIPEYIENYINESSTMPFFAAYVNEEPVGFIALKETSTVTAEIYCMDLLQYHRKGRTNLYTSLKNLQKKKDINKVKNCSIWKRII